MRRLIAALVLVLVAGCFSPESLRRSRAHLSGVEIGCLSNEVEVEAYDDSQTSGWAATCRGRAYDCHIEIVSPGTFSSKAVTRCVETAASNAETMRRVVIDRLTLETGCPASRISVDQEAAWRRGSEQAYRLTACGNAYVCTTAAGRTDCKAALSE